MAAPARGAPARGAPARGAPHMAGPGVPRNSGLLNPGAVLSGQDLYNAAKALAQAQTQGPINQLAQQIAQNNTQNTGALNLTGGYFNQLGAQAQAGADRVNTAGTNLNSQLQQIAQDENTQLQGLGQNATNTVARYSPGEGTATAGLQGLASEIARQQGIAAQQEGAQRAFGATQGANYNSLAGSQIGTGALKGQEDLSQIAQAGQLKNAPLAQKIADLRASEGALIASNLGKLRQQEITNNITQQGLGIKQSAINATVADNQRTNATSAANAALAAKTSAANNALTNSTSAANNALTNKTSAANNAATNATSRANNAATNAARLAAQSGTGNTKPLTPAQQNTTYRFLNEAISLIGQAEKAGHADADIRNALSTGSLQKGFGPIDPYLIQAAYELKNNGYITAQTAAAMRAHGLRGGTYRNAPIKVVNTSTVNGAAQGVGNTVANGIQNTFGNPFGT